MTDIDLTQMVIEIERHTTATPAAVWDVIWDLADYGRWNPECIETNWLDGVQGPAVGARFTGRNRRGDREWTVTCHIIDCVPPTRVVWTVLEPDLPSSTWSYDLTADGSGTLVRQRFAHGPGVSGVRIAIEARPEDTDAIIVGRTAMLAANMNQGLSAIIERAESHPPR